ncbi:MAG: hypothetical protein ACI4F5_01045 [Acutalibacteraceae bacterium]
MKEYIKRHHELSKLSERIYWWILRVIMIGSIIYSLVMFIKTKDSERLTQVAQSSANLFGMFAWEIMMKTSQKSLLSYIPSYVQNITLLGFFLGSFGGAFLNFYYSIPPYDIILHVFGGAEACFIGYELITAIQMRDRQTAPIALVLFGACGISFIFGVGWEIFEFTFDQLAGGDSQHWSYQLAVEACEKYGCSMPNVIDPLDPSRYALIDTMEDTIANVIGAVVMTLILKVKPYHHMGKNDVNKAIEEGKQFGYAGRVLETVTK